MDAIAAVLASQRGVLHPSATAAVAAARSAASLTSSGANRGRRTAGAAADAGAHDAAGATEAGGGDDEASDDEGSDGAADSDEEAAATAGGDDEVGASPAAMVPATRLPFGFTQWRHRPSEDPDAMANTRGAHADAAAAGTASAHGDWLAQLTGYPALLVRCWLESGIVPSSSRAAPGSDGVSNAGGGGGRGGAGGGGGAASAMDCATAFAGACRELLLVEGGGAAAPSLGAIATALAPPFSNTSRRTSCSAPTRRWPRQAWRGAPARVAPSAGRYALRRPLGVARAARGAKRGGAGRRHRPAVAWRARRSANEWARTSVPPLAIWAAAAAAARVAAAAQAARQRRGRCFARRVPCCRRAEGGWAALADRAGVPDALMGVWEDAPRPTPSAMTSSSFSRRLLRRWQPVWRARRGRWRWTRRRLPSVASASFGLCRSSCGSCRRSTPP